MRTADLIFHLSEQINIHFFVAVVALLYEYLSSSRRASENKSMKDALMTFCAARLNFSVFLALCLATCERTEVLKSSAARY
jgi:hypothetical protein